MLSAKTGQLDRDSQMEVTGTPLRGLNVSPIADRCEVAVIWIDWYAYHVSRFEALHQHSRLHGFVAGIEMVGGTGVHKGLKFREEIPDYLPVTTVFSEGDWASIGKWKMAVALWRVLDRLNPNTVLVPGYYTLPAVACAVWARIKRRRSVLMTESTEEDHTRLWWREALKSFLIRSLFSWAIAGGKAHCRYLDRLGFRSDRVARFYDVVNNDFFWTRAESIRVRHRVEEYGLPDRYFLFVGRLAEEKNVAGLLHSYLQYREQGGTWSLVVVGGGPEQHALQTQCNGSRYGSDVYFKGLKTSGELAPYYAFAGCFVLPSLREPWGLVVNEAMAAGLPVIVSNACGCIEDLVPNEENGFVFDPRSTVDLTHCLWEMSSATDDERQVMARRSRQIVDQYSPEVWAEEVARMAGL